MVYWLWRQPNTLKVVSSILVGRIPHGAVMGTPCDSQWYARLLPMRIRHKTRRPRTRLPVDA